MKSLLLLLALSSAARADEAVNASSITYRVESEVGAQLIFGRCTGTLNDPKGALAKLGIKAAALAEGVRCVAGDFDGNGTLDFALTCPYWDKGTSACRDIAVVFFSADGAQRTETFKHPRRPELFLYRPGSERRPRGEPASRFDALVDWGEGAMNMFYIHDPKKGRLRFNKYRSEGS
ncbi:MAG: hypothetical protein HYZ75_01450 [Elusimicrobia bacterium]|nr:hypothetical protein [Elusimicrobiota bacterium]